MPRAAHFGFSLSVSDALSVDVIVAAAAICAFGVGAIVAGPALAARLGWWRVGWVHRYRALRDGEKIMTPPTSLLYGTGLLLLGAALLLVRFHVSGAAAIVFGVASLLCSVVGYASRGGTAAWLKPRWLNEMEASNWTSYWGDTADRQQARRTERAFVPYFLFIGVGGALGFFLVLPAPWNWVCLGFGVSCGLGAIGTSLRLRPE